MSDPMIDEAIGGVQKIIKERNEALELLTAYYYCSTEAKWPDILTHNRTGALLRKNGRLLSEGRDEPQTATEAAIAEAKDAELTELAQLLQEQRDRYKAALMRIAGSNNEEPWSKGYALAALEGGK